MLRRHLACAPAASVSSAVVLMAACSGDDTIVPQDGGSDAKSDTTQQDTAPQSDAPADTSLDVAPDVASHCSNLQLDGDETDTDCGGLTCPKCQSNQKCLVNTDCVSGTCKNNHTCQ
jgi:hypothetical protein